MAVLVKARRRDEEYGLHNSQAKHRTSRWMSAKREGADLPEAAQKRSCRAAKMKVL